MFDENENEVYMLTPLGIMICALNEAEIEASTVQAKLLLNIFTDLMERNGYIERMLNE